jgi:hypothetical protein
MVWYALHLLAWLLVLGAVAPVFIEKVPESLVKVQPFRRWLGLILAPLLASGSLTLISRVVAIENLGGVQVGGAVGIWFFLAGLSWLGVLWYLPPPTPRAISLGVVLFILLWTAFGAMAQVLWLQWLLIPLRLRLWPLLSLACFPWFLASGMAQQGVGVGKRVLWWLGQSLALVGGFSLVLYLLPQLGFIFLLLPLFPLLMAIFSFAATFLNQVWSYALGCALLFGWMIAAAFPLGA